MVKVFSFFIGCILFFSQGLYAQITPQTALKSYLNNGDTAFKWELKDSYAIGDVKAYELLLTSQQWRGFRLTHQLTILVPSEHKYDGALLYISAGNEKDGLPEWAGRDDQLANYFTHIASKNRAIVAILHQTPVQPLYGNLVEDAFISYTLHNFKQDGDYTWPLLFPMVKGAVKAMTAIQEFSGQTLNHPVNHFVLAGVSKRGWTTWLTGASDSRVQAIIPIVIDVLNMPVSLDYQMQAYGSYSSMIQDYVKLGIPQGSRTESGMALNAMVDPYSYRSLLTMPKLLIMCTNDEFWVVDNVKNYLKEIPGKNLLHYVPNAGHSLGDGRETFETMSAFFGMTVANSSYPRCDWSESVVGKDVAVKIKATKDQLKGVTLWHADSEDKDFRNEKWSSVDVGVDHKGSVMVREALPASGYHAFYVELTYTNVNGQDYTVSTRVFMTDTARVL